MKICMTKLHKCYSVKKIHVGNGGKYDGVQLVCIHKMCMYSKIFGSKCEVQFTPWRLQGYQTKDWFCATQNHCEEHNGKHWLYKM